MLRNHLAAAGYTEIIPLAFSDAATERKFSSDTEPIRLLSPIAEDEAILRTSLVPTMLRTIQWNTNRGTRDLQFYELGKIYGQTGESRRLILAATGVLRTKNVHEEERPFNFYDLKGDVEDILDVFGLRLNSTS